MLTCFKLLKPIVAEYKWQILILDLCKINNLYKELRIAVYNPDVSKTRIYM